MNRKVFIENPQNMRNYFVRFQLADVFGSHWFLHKPISGKVGTYENEDKSGNAFKMKTFYENRSCISSNFHKIDLLVEGAGGGGAKKKRNKKNDSSLIAGPCIRVFFDFLRRRFTCVFVRFTILVRDKTWWPGKGYTFLFSFLFLSLNLLRMVVREKNLREENRYRYPATHGLVNVLP